VNTIASREPGGERRLDSAVDQGMVPRINPITAALLKEARQQLAALRIVSGDFRWQVREALEQLNEARRKLRSIKAKPESKQGR
jgi:hypothetical protein